ncbi:MAG: MBOAT family O-acyltransferase [Pseudomonadales bacterium]
MITVEQPIFLVWLMALVGLLWLMPARWVHAVLALSGAVFLAVYSSWSLAVLVGISVVTGLSVIHSAGQSRAALLAIAGILCIFIAYRVLDSVPVLASNVVMLGLAFYVLRAIHLLIESYAGRCGEVTWSQLLAWLWFMPTLQVGPINRFGEFRRDLHRRRWDPAQFSAGLQCLLFGYVKIIIFANYLVGKKAFALLQGLPHDSVAYHYLDSVYYGTHLYFKFAGYSDVAIGFALLIGFRVVENFNFPFLATNIGDFWKRWHISLASWCRDYVYLPVFSVTRTPALAAVASMLVLGVWHELSLRYLLWGIWHGVGVAVWQAWQKTGWREFLNSGWRSNYWVPCAWFITMNFVVLSFTLTGTASIAVSIERWQVLLGWLG